MPDLTLTVNGDPRIIPAPASLTDLLRDLDLDPRMVVVEHNRTIVRKDALTDTALADGDVIEIVHFVGGG
jgi:thiamine biosynthesis protein ThiS